MEKGEKGLCSHPVTEPNHPSMCVCTVCVCVRESTDVKKTWLESGKLSNNCTKPAKRN